MTHLQPPSRRNCDLVHKWADIYALPFFISTAGRSTTQNKPAVPVKCFKSLWGLCLITGETPGGWRWMLLKEKGVGSSQSEVGGESWLLRPVLETKPQNFPEVRLETPPCWGSVCHACVPRMCAWFHSHGNNSKAMILARFTESNGLPSYLKQNIYVESRVNGSGATRKATKSPLLTMVHSGDKLLEGKIKRNS